MMMEWTITSLPIIEQLSLALLHFLWQGFVVAGVAASLTRLLRSGRPEVRYRWCVLLFAVAAAGPVATFYLLGSPPESAAIPGSEVSVMSMERPSDNPVHRIQWPASPISRPAAARTSLVGGWEIVHYAVVLFWLTGQFLVGARIWLSAFFLFRIRRVAEPVQQELWQTAQTLSRKLAMRRCPRVASTAMATSAFATGLLRQSVIVPTAWLTDMTPEMLEAVLAHELAHLRRLDLWVNLFQRIVESVLFFHPAVWWLSKRIRQERELCCDQLAVQVTEQRKLYVETLEHVARRSLANSGMLVANLGDDRMSLLRRVLFVLGDRSSVRPAGLWPIGMVAIAVPCALYFASHDVPTHAEEQRRAVSATPAEPPAAAEQFRSASLVQRRQPKKHPTELTKATLPDYVVEPPDILLIQPVRLNPKPDYRQKFAAGEHLVGPDGKVNLGVCGRVKVSGLTVEQAKKAIEKTLATWFDEPEVTVDVLVFNSKFYYIITQGPGFGDNIVRLPITGNETVLDAVAQVGGLQQTNKCDMHIMRPTRDGAVRLEVDWDQITRGATTNTNYQLLPGDRIFVAERKHNNQARTDTQLQKDLEVIKLVQRYNQLIAEFRYAEAARLGKEVDEDLKHPLARLMTSHALLSQEYVPQAASSIFYVDTYDVADLGMPNAEEQPINLDAPQNAETEVGAKQALADFDRLISLITSTVQPNSWETAGGEGTIQAFPTNQSLVVSQNEEVHEQVAELLQQLRKARSVQTELEITDLQVPQRLVERLGLDGKQVAALSENEMRLLLNEAAYDPHARAFRGPKVLLYNGQVATVGVGSGDATMSYQLQSVITKSAVQLHVANSGNEDQANTIRLDAGQSILLRGVDSTPYAEDVDKRRRFKLITVHTVSK